MPIPNGGLITETNEQYYGGSQRFTSDGTGVVTTTFNTNLIFGSSTAADPGYALNNFQVYTSTTGVGGTYVEYPGAYTVSGNTISLAGALPAVGDFIAVQLKALDGGSFIADDAVWLDQLPTTI